MKITVNSSRKDDLIRQRDDWDARNSAQRAKHDAQYADFNSQQRAIFNSIKQEVLNAIGSSSINLDVKVDTNSNWKNPGVEVRVSSEQNNVHGADKALSWDWKVTLDSEGNPSKESSSWSGLQATTVTQLKSLKETVRVLETLNDIDWHTMLTVTLPDYQAIVTEPSTIGERPKFDQDIFDAELLELIGSNTLVKGTNRDGRGTVYYIILKDSGSMYTIASVSGHVVERPESNGGKSLAEVVEQAKNWSERIRKDTFQGMLKKPLVTVEV